MDWTEKESLSASSPPQSVSLSFGVLQKNAVMVEENTLLCPVSLLNLMDFNNIFMCQTSTEVIVHPLTVKPDADSLDSPVHYVETLTGGGESVHILVSCSSSVWVSSSECFILARRNVLLWTRDFYQLLVAPPVVVTFTGHQLACSLYRLGDISLIMGRFWDVGDLIWCSVTQWSCLLFRRDIRRAGHVL